MSGRPRIFAGWYVIAAVFVLFATSSGLGFYGLAIYLEALTFEQGFSTTSVSLATSAFFVVSGVSGRLIAPLLERHDVRIVAGVGGALSALSLWLLGTVESIPMLYVVYVIFAVGFAAGGLLPGTTLVTRWFHERRSVALAIAFTGLSIGGLTLTQLTSSLIDTRGLADAAPILATVYIVLTVVTVPFLWPDPQSRGLSPDGRAADTAPSAASTASVGYDLAVHTRFFAITVAGFILLMAAQVGGIAQLAKLGTERIDRPTGALAVSALAIGSVVGRFVGGVVVDRLPIITVTISLALLQGAALFSIAFADIDSVLVASGFAFGLTIGNLLMLMPLITATAFGIESYPRIYGLQQLLVTIGVAGGPLILGFLRDQSSYRTSYLVAAALSATGAVVLATCGTMRPTPAAFAAEPS